MLSDNPALCLAIVIVLIILVNTQVFGLELQSGFTTDPPAKSWHLSDLGLKTVWDGTRLSTVYTTASSAKSAAEAAGEATGDYSMYIRKVASNKFYVYKNMDFSDPVAGRRADRVYSYLYY